jgi:glycosyltransferase involved in cell wall biosynthesis
MRALPGHDFTVYALERAQDAPRRALADAAPTAQAAAAGAAAAQAPAAARRPETLASAGAAVHAARSTAALTPAAYDAPAAPAVTVLPLHGPPTAAPRATRRGRAEAVARFRDLAAVLALPAADADEAADAGDTADTGVRERFAAALYDLAALVRAGEASLPALLTSQAALRALEDACRAPGADPVAARARVAELADAARLLERALRPLHAPWYGPGDDSFGLADADLCHAVTGGTALLPGLLAKRFFGTPLLVTEHGSRLRETLLALRAAGYAAPVRALLGAFHRLLAAEAYARADALTAGAGHVRRWQRRCGADPARVRTVHPGYPDASAELLARAAAAADAAESDRPPLVVWVGRVAPAKDLLALLHAHAALRRAHPRARLRLAHPPVAPGTDPARYLAHCHEVAARLFPGDARAAAFVELGSAEAPDLAAAYAAADLVVLSSAVEGFPVTVVEAMLAGRAVVATDVGAVREVLGGAGVVVAPRNPGALAAACGELLEDTARRRALAAAGQERARELFTAARNVRAYRGLYLDLLAHAPLRPAGRLLAGVPA